MRPRKTFTLGGLVLATIVTAGCQTNDYELEEETRPVSRRTSPAAETAKSDPKLSQPYSRVKGQTTGDGSRVDMRSGGSITGTDVTSGERIEGNRQLPADNFTQDRSAIPTRPGITPSAPAQDLGTGGGTPASGTGPKAPSSGVAPGN